MDMRMYCVENPIKHHEEKLVKTSWKLALIKLN
jgi:hypothetical protein